MTLFSKICVDLGRMLLSSSCPGKILVIFLLRRSCRRFGEAKGF